MYKLICIACVMFLADATHLNALPSEGIQNRKVEKGEPTNSEGKLFKAEQDLSDLKEKPRDCYDVIDHNPDAISGVYTIFPPNYLQEGIEVWCDMDTDNGGWIVFQNRKNNSGHYEDFYRGWEDYLTGFGNLTQEFWLGLEYIHELTKYGTYDLRIDMSDFEQHEAYAVYSSFSIGEGPGYILKFADYFGDAGDSLAIHLNQKFSTMDMDQDSSSGNCAMNAVGAWWFSKCFESSLNGQYLQGATQTANKGIIWATWKGFFYSLKTANMKIRPSYANNA